MPTLANALQQGAVLSHKERIALAVAYAKEQRFAREQARQQQSPVMDKFKLAKKKRRLQGGVKPLPAPPQPPALPAPSSNAAVGLGLIPASSTTRAHIGAVAPLKKSVLEPIAKKEPPPVKPSRPEPKRLELKPPVLGEPKTLVPPHIVEQFREEYRENQRKLQELQELQDKYNRAGGAVAAQQQKQRVRVDDEQARVDELFEDLDGHGGGATALGTKEMQIKVERQRAANLAAERDAQRKSVHERSPAWWPRDPKPIVRKRPPPDPNMQAAAAARLKEIRAKLEAGEGLTAQEEEDATAILELKMIWAEQAKAAEEERQAARARPSAASADTPASMAKIMKAEARGQEEASLLTWS